MSNKYVLMDEEFQKKVLNELAEIRQLIIEKTSIQPTHHYKDLMDTADLTAYLKIDRRLVYKHRLRGMPFVRKMNDKLYYRKSEIDEYFSAKSKTD